MRYNKNQLNAYRGVLKNKNLAKVMEEGLTSAVGSTKRKRAQKVLSILKKTTVDGQGGSGPRSIPRVNVQLRPSTVDYSNLLILPPAPKIRVQFGEPAPTPRPEHDGQGYSGPLPIPAYQGQTTVATPSGNPLGPLGAAAMSVGNAGLSTLKFGDKYVGQPTRQFAWGIASAPFTAPTSRTFESPQFQTKTSSPIATNLPVTPAPTPVVAPLKWGVAGTGNTLGGPKLGNTYGSPILNALTGKTGPVSAENFLKNLKASTSQSGGGSTEMQTPGMQNFTDGATDPTTAAANNSSLNGRFPGVQEAVNSNLGPSMFAYNALKEEGGGMYERLMKIEEATRKSYGLDQMQDQLNSMIVAGNTLGTRLTDYVRGRDEFLNETEDMISDLKKRSMKMDMSDPRTRANTQQHFNYLYEMRGRQNKRYVEFMNAAIGEYEGKVAAAKSVYDTEFARYENEVLNKQNIAKEEYNMMFTGLQEMYNTVAGAEMAALEKEMMQHQVNSAYNQTIKDSLAMGAFNSGDAIQLDKDLKQKGFINSNGAWVPNNSAISISGANVYQLAPAMSDAVANAMYAYDEKGNRAGPVNKDEALRTVQNALMILDVLNRDGVVTGEAYAQHQNNIKGHLYRALESDQNFINTTEQLPSYRKAIESLAGDGWIWNKKTPTKEQFIKKWGPGGENLDSGVLNTIYANLEASTKAGESARSFVDTFLSGRGEFAQEGEPIDSDAVLRRNLISDYMQRLQPAAITPGLSFNKVGGGTNSASVQKAAQAIKNIESGGGNYRAVGPVANASGDRAYGAYQVMGSNIPSWTQAALGYAMTPAQFLNSPEAQDAVFAHIFGGYMQKFGTPEDAASAWFSGRPLAKAGNSKDVLGTSVPKYVQMFQNSYYG